MNMGEQADAIWGRCEGYPGAADSDRFVRYLLAHQVQTSLFFAAYGEQTVEQVRGNLDARQRLVDFALRAQGLERQHWRDAFLAGFGDG